ncbi:MAG: GNAT family N-acetyltransferase [Oceanicaulis sp.]
MILAAVGEDCDFLVIKQVGVHPDFHGAGLARRLYQRLFATRPADYAFAAIVERPLPNTGSKAFHAKLGFTPVLQASPSNDNYGDAIVNSIWFRQLRPPVHLPPSPETLAPEAWLENLEHVRALYKHEDQLNWTKVSLLITILFALLTAAWILLSEPPAPVLLAGKVILIGMGFVALLAVREKIRSGAKFMATHKTAARLTEAALAMRFTGFVAPLWHVPLTSSTSRWLKRLPGIALLVWTLASALLAGETVIAAARQLGF